MAEHTVRSGAELVELGERFFRGIFTGGTLFVGVSCVAALAFLPFRDSDATYTTPTVALVAALLLATPFALRSRVALSRLLRDDLRAQAVLVAIAAALVAYPLRSELWWPSCALLMLLAAAAGARRALAGALVALLVNLAAHVAAGDLGETPAVSIVGLWIGFGFWAAAFGLSPDRLGAHVLQLNARAQAQLPPPAPRVHVDARPGAAPVPVPESRDISELGLLTARQLEVAALLADGLRQNEIAAALGIGERQVQKHVEGAMRRLDVRSPAQLAARVVGLGLVPALQPS